MKNHVNRTQLGLTLGIFSGLLHGVWAVLVGLGIGKVLIDWVLPLHFIDMAYSITNFSWGTAVMLVILAFIGGYICGWLVAAIWNWVIEKVK